MAALDSQVITTSVGKPIEVELRSPGASGYVWSAMYDGTRVSLLEKHRKANLKRMGASAKEIFRFAALAAGDHQIHFMLRRPWEDEPVEQRDLVLHVR